MEENLIMLQTMFDVNPVCEWLCVPAIDRPGWNSPSSNTCWDRLQQPNKGLVGSENEYMNPNGKNKANYSTVEMKLLSFCPTDHRRYKGKQPWVTVPTCEGPVLNTWLQTNFCARSVLEVTVETSFFNTSVLNHSHHSLYVWVLSSLHLFCSFFTHFKAFIPSSVALNWEHNPKVKSLSRNFSHLAGYVYPCSCFTYSFMPCCEEHKMFFSELFQNKSVFAFGISCSSPGAQTKGVARMVWEASRQGIF